jgi:hypothetical protein
LKANRRPNPAHRTCGNMGAVRRFAFQFERAAFVMETGRGREARAGGRSQARHHGPKLRGLS